MSTFTLRNPNAPATEPQITFAAKLAAERGVAVPAFATQGEASAVITALKALPLPARPKAATGYYKRGDDYIVVVSNKAGTGTYAKILSKGETASGAAKWSWAYAPGLASTLAGDAPVSLEEAMQWSHLHGVCLRCCRALKVKESVARGMGPVCAKYFA